MDQLFRVMDSTCSASGEEYLYYLLRTPSLQAQDLAFSQEQYDWMADDSNADARIGLQEILSKLGHAGRYSLYDYIDFTTALGERRNLPHYIAAAAPFAAFGLMFLHTGFGLIALLIVFAFNLHTYFKEKAVIAPYFQVFNYILRLLDCAKALEKENCPAIMEETRQIPALLKAFSSFRRGSSLLLGSAGADSDPFGFIMEYVRILFHLDLIKFNNMLGQMRGRQQEIDALLTITGRIDACISIASWRRTLPVYAVPVLQKDSAFSAQDLYHPLLEEAVPNSIEADRPVLLTGSNASGKSTFLKAAALCALLSQTVGIAPAGSYSGGCYRIYTSMALRDSLQDGESYFIVEIKSLGRILDAASQNRSDTSDSSAERQDGTAAPVLCCIDEVLRGTNTVERIAASAEILRCFALTGTLCFAATHDLELTGLLSDVYDNFHFSEEIVDGDVRFSYRLVLLLGDSLQNRAGTPVKKVMLIGAGSAGRMILQDIHNAREIREQVVCIIDDSRNKWGRYIDDVPVVGGRDYILEAVEKYGIEKIYIAIPSATASQLAKGDVSVSDMKNVSVEDLLGRDQIRPEMKEVYDFVSGKVVLVTGGGGSIGSELCRQIAAHSPRRLIIFDIYENNAYDIQLELREKYPDLQLETLIGSVRDSRRIYEVFEKYHPEIVYHAAAHKHVPLMEDSPCESIKNNAIGTYKTAYAAMVHGCSRFVLISTDKAVNPTNIMGASKRLCEMIIQSFDQKIKEGKAAEIPQLFTHEGIENADPDGTGRVFENVHTEFVAVRFGNVLGSNGSVIPIFRKQIAKGGPVTVTHPDIIRYFMTIPEAVSLVMLAGTFARGGEIFVLDMGSPVKIDTLARNLIRLSGYKPDVDIKIEYTGLRPGEKLYEEKLMAEEGLRKTDNALIHIGNPIPFEVNDFLDQLENLMEAAYANREDDIRGLVEKTVSTYKPEKGSEGAEKDSMYEKLLEGSKEES